MTTTYTIDTLAKLLDCDTDTAAVAHIVGDHQYNWLSWYAAENEMGHIGLEAGPVNDAKPIRTIEDLAWLIEVTR